MTSSTGSALADALNAMFGLELASFADAKAWMNFPEGNAALDAWTDRDGADTSERTSPT